jgi:8-oxo-dGTP pyrophosphatase MutT (NUDIX family)
MGGRGDEEIKRVVAEMNPGSIRPISIGVVRRDASIFVFEGHDTLKEETFYRPLGGGIEFGERSAQAVRREFQEELSAELANLRPIGVLENLFTHEGRPWHEIVFVFEADFTDTALYDQKFVTCIRENDCQFKAMWMPISDFSGGKAILYPDGLLELLSKDPNGIMNPGAGGTNAIRNKPVE